MQVKFLIAKRVLQTMAGLHVFIGLVFPWVVHSAWFSFYMQHLNQAFTVSGIRDEGQAIFLLAVFGPTLASWGVLFLFGINAGFARPSASAWWFLVAACLVWALCDSVLSLVNGVYLNAIINAVVFVFLISPLLIAKEYFYHPSVSQVE